MTTETVSFRIRRAFLLPQGLLVALTAALWLHTLATGATRAQTLLGGAIALGTLLWFVSSLLRRATVTADTLHVRKLLHSRTLPLAEVTAVDSLVVRNRAFVTLSRGDHFLILSNAYERFPEMVRTLLERVPAGTVADDTRQMAATPPEKSSDIISCWLAAALVALILGLQLSR